MGQGAPARPFRRSARCRRGDCRGRLCRRVWRQLAGLRGGPERARHDPGDALDLPLDIRGTAFQARVWRALQKIPPGRTATYSDIAAALGQPRAVRAVAQACASNKLAVVVPCHRVVRRDGDLAGYRWGVERKRALLAKERETAPADAAAD